MYFPSAASLFLPLLALVASASGSANILPMHFAGMGAAGMPGMPGYPPYMNLVRFPPPGGMVGIGGYPTNVPYFGGLGGIGLLRARASQLAGLLDESKTSGMSPLVAKFAANLVKRIEPTKVQVRQPLTETTIVTQEAAPLILQQPPEATQILHIPATTSLLGNIVSGTVNYDLLHPEVELLHIPNVIQPVVQQVVQPVQPLQTLTPVVQPEIIQPVVPKPVIPKPVVTQQQIQPIRQITQQITQQVPYQQPITQQRKVWSIKGGK